MNIPSHLYVLLDRNILCNCDIEAESDFLLESLAACNKHRKTWLRNVFHSEFSFFRLFNIIKCNLKHTYQQKLDKCLPAYTHFIRFLSNKPKINACPYNA